MVTGNIAVIVQVVCWNEGADKLKEFCDQLDRAIRSDLAKFDLTLHLVHTGQDPHFVPSDYYLFNVFQRKTPENVGYGRGHNLLLTESCDFRLIANLDIDLSNFSLKKALERFGAKDVAIWSPGNKEGDRGVNSLWFPRPTLWYPLIAIASNFPLIFRRISNKYKTSRYDASRQELTRVDCVSGCFFIIRDCVFRALNGFDERFFLYFEDADLCLRSQKYGFCLGDRAQSIRHLGGNVFRKSIFHWGFYLESYAKFHWKWKRPWK